MLALAVSAQSSLACPDCAPVRAARAAIAADPERWLYAFAVAAPFVVASVVIALVYRAGAGKEPRSWR
ncbi:MULTISPECIES: hypothetical protein [Nannocystis]|uniref:Uncharacterized protein n=1 Tax=Nannocystis radixulma TaxID=2995305 RepID=A0ABT5BDE4_9BACT|nr:MULTISPECIES: hypothetical protein [Nannocystis]MCY1059211.1 hypothetical protein [Nannocystis sp. SCPEA4]MDC0672165.1 hypothetical protein [Nannocystis radixulma]